MKPSLSINSLHQVALTSTDLDEAQSFYEEQLGLRMIARFDPPGLMFFDAGGVRLSIQRVDAPHSTDAVIYFRVSDIDSASQTLKDRGVTFERDAELVFHDREGQFGKAGEEEWMAFFRDPDGHLLALASRE
ncbi:MAG TPA: VOC family protein [Woeseiaceae bacterium]|nr:VOC family protein [Woeseiaceae bacterium]